MIGVVSTRAVRGLGALLTVLLLSTPSLSMAQTTPTEAEVRDEVREFQGFFLSRFPDVPLEAYRQGVDALPQNTRQKLNRDLLLAAPPQDDALAAGRAAWDTLLPSGQTLTACFTGKPPPTAYPYFFNGEVRTIAGDINQCRELNGLEPLDELGGEMARLVAAFKAPWQGQPIDIDYRDEEMRRLYAIGRETFWAKRGQMNLSCANCHVHNAGNRLRGQVLSAALGHGAGYPAYSLRWAADGEPMGTQYRRYARCNALAGAAPLLPGESDAYLGLQVYQAILNNGIPLSAPALRP